MLANVWRPAIQIALASAICGTLLAQQEFPSRQITSDPAQEGFPTWSPDGRWLVYSYSLRDDDSVTAGLRKIPAGGGEPTVLLAAIAEHPNWSRDGHYIVFDADTGNAIKLVSAHGGQPVRVVPASIPVFRGGNPNWAPDNARIAFREGPNLWVLDVRTGAAEVIFTREGSYPIPGCWSRDGREVFVTVRDIETYAAAIVRVPISGAEPQRLTPDTTRQYRYLDLSPDGTLLAYVACEGRNCDIWVMPSGGGPALQLTYHPASDGTPRWSPGGTEIAFTSTRSGNFDVWVLELDMVEVRAALRSPPD